MRMQRVGIVWPVGLMRGSQCYDELPDLGMLCGNRESGIHRDGFHQQQVEVLFELAWAKQSSSVWSLARLASHVLLASQAATCVGNRRIHVNTRIVVTKELISCNCRLLDRLKEVRWILEVRVPRLFACFSVSLSQHKQNNLPSDTVRPPYVNVIQPMNHGIPTHSCGAALKTVTKFLPTS